MPASNSRAEEDGQPSGSGAGRKSIEVPDSNAEDDDDENDPSVNASILPEGNGSSDDGSGSDPDDSSDDSDDSDDDGPARYYKGLWKAEKAKREKLQAQLDRLKGLGDPPKPWQDLFLEYQRGDPDALSWGEIYRICCKQENMSMKPEISHPDIQIVDRDITNEILRIAYPPQNGDNLPLYDLSLYRNRQYLSIILPHRFFRLRPILYLTNYPNQPFPFERLPSEIQARIFKLVFVKSTLVHCLSRLDRAHKPLNFSSDDRRTGLPHRFHIGTRPCSVTLAHKPNNILRPLLVSKKWLFIGVHCFYGVNTFAFSSLGELGKFCNGIGRARVQRIQHIEVMWHGNRMHPGAKMIEQENGSHRLHKVSKRTMPLRWLTQMNRLKTFLAHIEESDRRRVRRPYEMKCYKDWYKDEYYRKKAIHKLDTFGQMVKRTETHPNFRKYRSLRTVHGMDYVYQLRGMKWVRFKDTAAPEHRTQVRDWSFLNDINSVCTQPKPNKHARQSLLQNLAQISGLGDWEPSEHDVAVVRGFYDEDPAGGTDAASSAGQSTIFSARSDPSDTEDEEDADEDADDADGGSGDDDDDDGGNRGSGDNAAVIELDSSDSEDSDDENNDTPSGSAAGSQDMPLVIDEDEDENSDDEAGSGNDGPEMEIDPAQPYTDDSSSDSGENTDSSSGNPMDGVQETQTTSVAPRASGLVIDLTNEDDDDDDADDGASIHSTAEDDKDGEGNMKDRRNDDGNDAASMSEGLFVPKGSYAFTTSSGRTEAARSEDGDRPSSHIKSESTAGLSSRRAHSASDVKTESSSDAAWRKRVPYVDLTDDGAATVKRESPSAESRDGLKRPRDDADRASTSTGPSSKRSRSSATPSGLMGALRAGIFKSKLNQQQQPDDSNSDQAMDSD